MKQRTTLVLLGVLAVLLAYVLIFEQGETNTDGSDETATSAPAILSLDASEIQTMRIRQPATGLETVLQRNVDDNMWHVVEPMSDLADQSKVRVLAQTLASLTATRVLTGAVDSLDVYGLESPDVITVLEGEDQTRTLRIGDETATGGGYYAQVDGDPRVFIIMSYVARDLMEYVETPPIQPTPTPTQEPMPEPSATPVA